MGIGEILDLELEYVKEVDKKIVDVTNNLSKLIGDGFGENIKLLQKLLEQKEEIIQQSREAVESLCQSFNAKTFLKEKENIENAIKELDEIKF